MANLFMAGYALGIDDTVKIIVVKALMLRSCFKVAVTGKTARVVNIFFTFATQGLPVDSRFIFHECDPGIVRAGFGFTYEVGI